MGKLSLQEMLSAASRMAGNDCERARIVHMQLCNMDGEKAAPFAAEMVLRAIDLYAQADQIMHRLAVLAK